jgi:dethiobiotin synthetase
MTAVFVTSTGTDIGKTFVTAGLIRLLKRKGKQVEALKPLISGFDPSQPAKSDSGVLLQALGLPVTDEELEDISPWRYKAPLSPDMAARHEGDSIDYDQLVAFCDTAIEENEETDALLIEGVGGVMVPLDHKHTVLDWIIDLDLPTVLVAGSYLGSISHTLTAVGMLDREDCDLATIVVSETAGSHVPLYETVATLSRFLPTVDVIALPRLADGGDHPAFEQIAKSCGLI